MAEIVIAVLQSRFRSVDVEAEALAELKPRFVEAASRTADEIIGAASEADGIIAGAKPRFTAEVLRQLPRCKVIVFNGVGVENIDVAAATACGIQVSHVPDYCVEEVSTHTLALLLALARKLPDALAQVRGGSWNARGLGSIVCLDEQILGVAGFGRIGEAVALKAKAFGLRIWIHDPYIDEARIRQLGFDPKSLDELSSNADYLTLHMPLTPDSRHLINASLLRRMKPTASIINTSRGALVDEAALIEALNNGRLAAAALDVLSAEPPPADHPLLHHPKVLITPHAGWYSDAAEPRVRRLSAEDVRLALTGKRPRSLLNPEVLG